MVESTGGPLASAQQEATRGTPFFLLPSVGTWLQARPKKDLQRTGDTDRTVSKVQEVVYKQPAVSKAFKVKDAPQLGLARERQRFYGLKPSVGTWLQPRFDQEFPCITKKVDEPAWEADFESFLQPPKGLEEEGAPVVAASVEPSREGSFQAPSRPPSGLFLLTPPPQPTTRCAVQTVSRASDVVVLEEDDKSKAKVEPPAEEKPLKAAKRSLSTTEELIGTNRAPDDDEELLLGDDAVGLAEGFAARRPAGDGVDSASESDVGEQRVAARAAAPPSKPVPKSSQPVPEVSAAQVQEPPPAAAVPPPPAPVGPPRSSAPASKAAEAEAVTEPLREGALVAPQPSKQAPLPSTSPPPKAGQPPPAAGTRPGQAAWVDVDSQVAKRLDNFFGDRNAWDRVSTQCAGGNAPPAAPPAAAAPAPESPARATFKVRVPAPHPGLQYRRSKHLGDRYQRYVENGSNVTGQVEEDGLWLRLSHNVFLPMMIDGNQVLEALPAGAGQEAQRPIRSPSPPNNTEQLSWIWGWCTGCRDGQVMVDADILVRGDAPRAGELPMSHSSR